MHTFKSSPNVPDTQVKTIKSRLIINNNTGKCKKAHSSKVRMWRHVGLLKTKCVCMHYVKKSGYHCSISRWSMHLQANYWHQRTSTSTACLSVSFTSYCPKCLNLVELQRKRKKISSKHKTC